MKLAIILAATILAVSALSEKDQWESFKVEHNKTYRNLVEENYRFEIFRTNLKDIEEHNKRYEAGEVGYFKGVNQFADITKEEFSAVLGFRSANRTSDVELYEYLGAVVPDYVDWRQYGAVLPVRQQGTCGSCWAFSATGALEAQNVIVNNIQQQLSPQELLDCSDGFGQNDCIKGGDMIVAFQYVMNMGLDYEYQYPYLGYKSQCYARTPKAIQNRSYRRLEPDENAMKEAVATVGPLSIALNADPLQLYAGGIFDSYCDPNNVNHGVLIIGYGTEYGEDYWIVKNSWGPNYGENGFFRIRRGYNQCGLTHEVSYPIL